MDLIPAPVLQPPDASRMPDLFFQFQRGRDRFTGEPMEVRDFDLGESLAPPVDEERSHIPPSGPPVDALIAIEDPALRVALAESLDYAVTKSYLSTPGNPVYVIHVPDGSPITQLPLSDGETWSQRILASLRVESLD